MPDARRDENGPLEVELRMVENHHVDIGTEPGSSARARRVLNC